MQKVNCSYKKYWENTLLSINIVIDDRLSCKVNKVYMYMVLVVRIYTFLITISILILLSPKQIQFSYLPECDFKDYIVINVTCVYNIVSQILKPYIRFVFDSIAFR